MRSELMVLKTVVLTITLLTVSCVHIPPPPGAIPGRITVVTDTNSPYWRSWINHYVPRGVNDYAHYQIVDGNNDAPYKLLVHIVNADSYISGYSANRYGASANYRTRLEVEVMFLDQNSHSIWSWSGWADYDSGAQSMKKIAKRLGKAMSEEGLLVPSYYPTTAHVK